MKLKENQTTELLNYFFSFINLDIDKVDFDSLPVVVMAYVRFAFHDDGQNDFTKYKDKYDLLSEGAFRKSNEKLSEAKSFLKSVQDILRDDLDALTRRNSPKPLKQKGIRVLMVVDDKFIEKFEFDSVPEGRLDIDLEKQKAKAALADILLNGNLIPSRFKRCKYCDNYFYQPTARKKEYCSNSCASAVRMQKKRDREKD